MPNPLFFLLYYTGILFSTLNRNLYFKSPTVTHGKAIKIWDGTAIVRTLICRCHISKHNLMTLTMARILDLGPRTPCRAICLGLYFRSYKYNSLRVLLTRSLILSSSSILQQSIRNEVKCLATHTVNPEEHPAG